MSTGTATAVEAVKDTVKKATETVKKAVKKAAKKVAKKASKKATKKAKSTDGLSAKERQAAAAERPVVWSESRVAVVKALRKLGAKDPTSARTASDISEKSGVDVVKVKVHCDVYRGHELIQHGIVKSVRHEGSRELSYYLTAKGVKADFAA